MNTLLSKFGAEKEVGVPRRFSISAVFALVTIYCVLFRVLVLLGANASWTGLCCLFVGAVTIAQMTMFRGVRPRAASMVAGAIAAPAILLLVMLDETFTRFLGMTPIESGFGTFGRVLPPLLFLAAFGLGIGYLVGIALAGVFYIASRIWPEESPAQSTVGTTDELKDSQLFRFLARTYDVAGQILNPIPKGNPLRGALAIFEACVVMGLLIAPFVTFLVPSQVWVVFAVTGLVVALWVGNLQLLFLWPVVLAMIGYLLADSVFESMRKIPMIGIQFTGDHAQRLTCLWLTRYAGLFVGVSLSAIVGWIQWFTLRNREKVRFGWVAFGISCLMLWGCSRLLSSKLEKFAETPIHQLQAKVCQSGGLLLWNLDGSLNHIDIPRGFDDAEAAQLVPLLSTGGSLILAGESITNATAAQLEGRSLSTLGLSDTQIDAEGLAQITSFSAAQLSLTNRNVDLKLLASLLKDPRMPTMLQVLTLFGGDLHDQDFQVLRRCPGLTNTRLNNCGLTDDDMASLAASLPKSVVWLGLDSNGITDAGLQQLQRLKQLKYLSLKQNPGVTVAGVESFRVAHPSCVVGFTEPNE